MGARVSLSALLSSSALAGSVRATLSAFTVAEALAGPIRSSLSTAVIAEALSGKIRSSGSYLLVARSVNFGVEFNTLDSNSALYGIDSWSFTLGNENIPEHNPYKPTIPESVIDTAGPETYDYLKENQEIIRQQHNLTQAGDTTFPHEMITSSHTIKHFTLGSLSRFFHEDYGIIQARYVQFDKMVPTDRPCAPVGLLGKHDTHKWVVTNNLDLSHPDLVVGISAPWNKPNDGDYGWVIVDGPVLQPLANNSTVAAQGESFAWDATGSISNTAKGKVIARRVNRTPDTSKTALLAGQAYVRVESFSENQIADVVADSTKALTDSLDKLQTQVQDLPDLGQLGATVAQLKAQLNQEATVRQAADTAINQALANLDAVTQAELDSAITAASNAINSTIANLSSKVDAMGTALDSVVEQVSAMNGVEDRLQAQINGVLTVVGSLIRRKVSKFPVVDGSVPPNLVYLDDGTLVYTEV